MGFNAYRMSIRKKACYTERPSFHSAGKETNMAGEPAGPVGNYVQRSFVSQHIEVVASPRDACFAPLSVALSGFFRPYVGDDCNAP